MKWKNIETAPKTEGILLIGNDGKDVFLFHYCKGNWQEFHVHGEITYEIDPLFWDYAPIIGKEE